MHIVYSALAPATAPETPDQINTKNKRLIRYHAYQRACNKHSEHIEAIRKYFLGWMPAFK